jgi:hypothetical protein
VTLELGRFQSVADRAAGCSGAFWNNETEKKAQRNITGNPMSALANRKKPNRIDADTIIERMFFAFCLNRVLH